MRNVSLGLSRNSRMPCSAQFLARAKSRGAPTKHAGRRRPCSCCSCCASEAAVEACIHSLAPVRRLHGVERIGRRLRKAPNASFLAGRPPSAATPPLFAGKSRQWPWHFLTEHLPYASAPLSKRQQTLPLNLNTPVLLQCQSCSETLAQKHQRSFEPHHAPDEPGTNSTERCNRSSELEQFMSGCVFGCKDSIELQVC